MEGRTALGSADERGFELLGPLFDGARAVPRIIAGVSHWFRDTLLSSLGYLVVVVLLMMAVFGIATSDRMNKLA